nr:hypothetical protein [Psychrobacter celer]
MSKMSAIQSVHLKRIEHYVNLNLANPHLSPNTVAAACHISVRYLHKLFASLPYSFSEWVKMLRLKQANHILKSNSYVPLKKSLIGSAMVTKVTFLAFINSILVIHLKIRAARDNKVLLTLN